MKKLFSVFLLLCITTTICAQKNHFRRGIEAKYRKHVSASTVTRFHFDNFTAAYTGNISPAGVKNTYYLEFTEANGTKVYQVVSHPYEYKIGLYYFDFTKKLKLQTSIIAGNVAYRASITKI